MTLDQSLDGGRTAVRFHGRSPLALEVAERWFELRRFSDDVTLIREPHVFGAAYANMWHVRGRDKDLLLDTGTGVLSLRAQVAQLTERPPVCVASHTHFDHIGGHHEFEERLVHAAEADILAAPDDERTLLSANREACFQALPYAGFDIGRYGIAAAPATRLVAEGDIVDLGDRHFEVMHLPGHSPGSICLWEAATRTLLSGDVVTEGAPIDEHYHSDIPDYIASLERLRDLPAEIVHPGHYESLGRPRMVEIIDDYLAGKRKPGCPAAP